MRLAARDPGNLALARAVRATLLTPILFGAFLALGEPAVASTAAFGSVAALVFADFGGRPRGRFLAYVDLAVAGSGVLTLGTLVSESIWWSVPLTFVVAAGVRFVGHFGPRWNAAVSPTILAFVLGVLVPAPAAAIPERLAGWLVGVVLAGCAAVVVMPTRVVDEIDDVSARASLRLADALEVIVHGDDAARAAAAAPVRIVRAELREAMVLPVRPAGPGFRAMARRRILDRLVRLAALLDGALGTPPTPPLDATRAVASLGAGTLRAVAAVLRGESPAGRLRPRLESWDAARHRALDEVAAMVASETAPAELVERVDAGFVVRAGAWHADAVARNVAVLCGAAEIVEDLDDVEPRAVAPTSGPRARATTLARFFGAHARPESFWFRDALRAGVALAAAVWLGEALSVQHAFWVALATLSVLRSSALATGQSAVEAAIGTSLGFMISAMVFVVVGLDEPALWVLFVVGVFAVGYLPQVAGFGAGQAAFAVTVVALFNLLEPEGWQTGLTRLEDVVLGAAVSAVVALVFWPRRLTGLTARLAAQLSDAAGRFLVAAVRDDDVTAVREEERVAEVRARTAATELVVQHRSTPGLVMPWVTRIGVGAHTRSAGDAIVRVHELFAGAGAAGPLGAALLEAAETLRVDLAPGTGHPPSSRVRDLAVGTRAAAEAAIAAGAEHPRAVVRDLLVRDWLLAIARMVDARP